MHGQGERKSKGTYVCCGILAINNRLVFTPGQVKVSCFDKA